MAIIKKQQLHGKGRSGCKVTPIKRSVESGIDEELEVLKSIYIEELNISLSERSQPEVISLRLHPSTGDEEEKKYVCITLELELSQQYPHEIPTINIKNPRGIGEEEVNRLQESLVTLATELQGGPMLYDLIELAKEKLTEGNIPHCPCTICYEHFHEGEEFTKTHCYHYFHCHCLAHYVRHVLASIQQENQSRPTHQQDDGGQTKVPCPVCREEMECNVDLYTGETTPQDQSLNFYPTAELRTWQREMSRLLRRQRERGGVIDVQEERNKFLITQDDVVELNLTSIQDTDPESSTRHSTESSTKNSTEASSKDQGTNVTVKDSGKSRNTGILNKAKTTFKASRLPQQIQMLEREFDRRWTRFSEEFENLNRRGAPGGSKKEGQRPENRHKNRVKHLVPYDDTRVVLKDGDSEVKGSDYICAAYIQITSETSRADGGRLIATQGCLSETVGDFWRMVWQERSQVIVMATKAVEDDRVKVSRYWCEEGEERLLEGQNYKFQVKGQSVTPHRDYVLRELEVTRLSGEGQGEGSRLMYQFNFTAWPDFGVPKNPAAIIDFLATVNSKQAELTEAGPMVIHCSAGLGRTGTLVVIEALIHQIKEEGLDCDLDIQKTVLKVRSQRPGMIQTEPQYKFIYKALLSYLQSQPGFTPEQGTLDSYHEEAHRQRFVPKDRRGRGRGRPVNQRPGVNDRLSRARDTQSHPGNHHSDEDQSGKSHTDNKKNDSLIEKNADEVTSNKSQERRGFGKPKSSQKAERNPSESHETGGVEENAAAGMSKDSINEKRNNEDTRKGFGRPRSGQIRKSDQGHHESGQQRSPRNQKDTGNSKDSSTQRETRKGFGQPPERLQHDKGD
uniref:E3 ubiquitin-protein ligase RNF25 n=1 Tax=Magallana gigas TaxID=29159 RepID=A0A8W8KJC1_MAGGI